MGGFVEHTFKRPVVSHDLKGSSVQKQVTFLAPKITCQSFLIQSGYIGFRVGEAPTGILYHSPALFSRLSLRKCCDQTHRAPINMKLVLRLGIKVCLDWSLLSMFLSSSNASECSGFHSNFPVTSSPSLHTAF